jgi:hypothetical protein
MPLPKRYTTAFKEGFNLVGLSSAVALSVATLNPLPLLVGLVAEAAYLLFVPDSKWYDQRLSKKHDAEVEQRRAHLKAQVVPMLDPGTQTRFQRLEEDRFQIGSQPLNDQSWFRDVLRKLDYLLEKFLLFASKEVEFRTYLRSVLDEVRTQQRRPARPSDFDLSWADNRRDRGKDRGRHDVRSGPPPAASSGWTDYAVQEIQGFYHQEMDHLRKSIEAEGDEDTKAVQEKRLDVLQRRHESVGKLGKILTNLSHQLQLLEDTFGLINDEIRARSPEQVLSDIEDVVFQTDTMTKLIEEIAPFDQILARIG